MLAPFFKDLLNGFQQNWREVVSHRHARTASRCPRSAPRSATTTATAARVLPANLLQAQRDFFGAHTYERTDKPGGEMFHTDWPEVIE